MQDKEEIKKRQAERIEKLRWVSQQFPTTDHFTPTKQKIVIELREWDYYCGDGCCLNYGTDIIVNGVKIEDEDGTGVHQALSAVLRHLGYDVEVR